MKNSFLLICALVLMVCLSPVGKVENVTAQSGQVYTFTDGYGGNVFTAQDNLLNSNPSAVYLNLGQHENFELANYSGTSPSQVALMRFNLASIPANARVVSATLYLYKSYQRGAGGGTITAEVYSVSRANRDWVAGRGDLDTARGGESCWAAKACDNGRTVTPWAGSPGLGRANIDYETPRMGRLSWTPVDDPIGQEYAISLSPGRVACWFGQNNTNYGIAIKNVVVGSDHQGQSEHSTPAYRPKLVVRYRLDSTGTACGESVALNNHYFIPYMGNGLQ